jgi:beta-phosphoglucomutase-like phosphatase (HAD superfamily)
MGNDGAKSVGLGKAAVTVEDSIAGVVAIVSVGIDCLGPGLTYFLQLEKATNKTVLGPVLDYEGKEYLW